MIDSRVFFLQFGQQNNSDSEGDIEPDNTITNVRKRSRRPAIAPGIPIGDGGQFLIE